MEVGSGSCDSPKEISRSASGSSDHEFTDVAGDAKIPLSFPDDDEFIIERRIGKSCRTSEECGACEEFQLSSHPGIHHRSRIKKKSFNIYDDDSRKNKVARTSQSSSSSLSFPYNTFPVFTFTSSQLFLAVSVFIVALVVSIAGADNKDIGSFPVSPHQPSLNQNVNGNHSSSVSFLASSAHNNNNGITVVGPTTPSTSSFSSASSSISSTVTTTSTTYIATTTSTATTSSTSYNKDKSTYPGSRDTTSASPPHQSSSYTFLNETHPFRGDDIDLFNINARKEYQSLSRSNNNRQLVPFQSDEPEPNQVLNNNRKSPSSSVSSAVKSSSRPLSSSVAQQKARKGGSNSSSLSNVTAAFTPGSRGYISTRITKTLVLNTSSSARKKSHQPNIIFNLKGAAFSDTTSSTASSQYNYKAQKSPNPKDNPAHYFQALTSISAPESRSSSNSKSSPFEKKQPSSSSYSSFTSAPTTTEASPSYKDALARRAQLQIRRDLSRRILDPDAVLNDEGDDTATNPNSPQCDRIYLSTPNGIRNGTFESPTLVGEDGRSLQCIYIFLARPEERVEITFTQFDVRGTPPECVHEWVDLYTEVEDPDIELLIEAPYGGRYCGKIPPRKRISLYGGIAIGFMSDKNSTDETLFRGTYAFFDGSKYVVGTPIPRTQCSFTILGTSQRSGDILSPTYPGVYPKQLQCIYKFIGIQGQRIRLEFRDFDLFFGGPHCPFDDVKIFDGNDTNARVIGTYCGQQRNLVVYSSEHLMLVSFTTLDRNTEAQNRGFKGVWEFSESFVKLDFIGKNAGEHILGTECDQRILSKGQSSGAVYSPNYPFPYLPKIVCRYFVYGLQDPQFLERVKLIFEKFDVASGSNNSDEEGNNPSSAGDKSRCGDGFLKIYLKGQEMIQAYDKADYEFCGKEVPQEVVSDGPRLVLVFSSGETQVGSGFKARYVFETEYRIPGTPKPPDCHFTYRSLGRKRGEFNSPRFPANYPSDTNCTYIFVQEPNEQVRIVFDNFKLRADKINFTGGTYGQLCQEDWVEIYNVLSKTEDRIVGRYCGQTAPGPIESREQAIALKILLHTDEEGVFSGFKARYIYFQAKSIFGDCGKNITQAQSGVLTSPKWPGNYDGPSKGEGSSTCNWYLTVQPGSRVMLHFQAFAIEGEPFSRGCPAATVRIWEDPDGVPVELCGEALPLESGQYVSNRNVMRVTFITADKAVGARGFRAVWTEVQDGTGVNCQSSYILCDKSKFCIPDNLRCDGTRNCGSTSTEIDSSDELLCINNGEINVIFLVVLVVVSVLTLVVIVCVWAQRKKRRRRRRLQMRRPPIHVCDNAGARFAAMDSV